MNFQWCLFPKKQRTKRPQNSGKIRSKIRCEIRDENSKNSGHLRSASFLTLTKLGHDPSTALEETEEKFRKDPRKALRAFPGIPEFSPPQCGWGRLFFQNWSQRGPLAEGISFSLLFGNSLLFAFQGFPCSFKCVFQDSLGITDRGGGSRKGEFAMVDYLRFLFSKS